MGLLDWFRTQADPRVTTEVLGLHNWRRWTRGPNHWIATETVKRWDAENLPSPTVYGCNRCGYDWKTRPSHVTWHRSGSGASPLCQICWDELETAEARLPYYKALWWLWEMQAAYRGCPFGRHVHGRYPFEVGHEHPRWEEVERAVRADSAGVELEGVYDQDDFERVLADAGF